MHPSIRIPAFPVASLALLAACSAAPDPSSAEPTRTDEAQLVATRGAEPQLPCSDTTGASDGGTSFTACQADFECVAVPLVGCCNNGWKAAVNRCEVDAYESSFTCPEAHPVCPLYRVDDTRQPQCVAGECEMVAPSRSSSGSPTTN